MQQFEEGALRAAIYARVSTEEQATEGISLSLQEHRCRSFIEAKGWVLAGVFRDPGFSAGNTNRPALDQVREAARRGEVDVVVFLKIDRFSRNVRDLAEMLEEFARRGVRIASVQESLDTSTAGGKLVLNILASVAQWERDVIAERTSAAMQALKRAGRRIGGAPFGLRWERDELLPVPDELEVVDRMRRLRARKLSFSAIARRLRELGAATRNGGEWTHVQVGKVLRDERVLAAAEEVARVS